MTNGDPWSLIEGLLAVARGGDLGLLKQCLDLAQQYDGDRGVQRVQRRLLVLGLGSQEARRGMLDRARTLHASLCPWCYTSVTIPREVGTPRLRHKHGQLASLKHRIRLIESGWRTRLEIKTPNQVLYRGPEPDLRLTRHGAAWILAGPWMFVALSAAFIGPTGEILSALVAGCLIAALVSFCIVSVIWQPRPRDERIHDHAWHLLAPRLLKHSLKPASSAFLAALARKTLEDESPLPSPSVLDLLLLRGEKAIREGPLPPGYLALWRRMAIQATTSEGADPIPLVAQQVSRCFQGLLPMLFAECLLDGWRAPWMTPGARARLRILVTDQAFESGFEVADLLVAGQTAPALAALLRINEPEGLAALRLLWSLRPTRPWIRCGASRTVFDLAAEPSSAGLLVSYPDLLLAQDSPELPLVMHGDPPASLVQILLCTRGLFFQSVLFTAMPRMIETRRRKIGHELRLDGLRFRSEQPLDQAAALLELWFRYAFSDFLPDIRRALTWRSPDRTIALRAVGALGCPECGKYFKGRIGEVGVALDEESTTNRGESDKPRRKKKKDSPSPGAG